MTGRPLSIIALVGDFPAVSKTFIVDQLLGLIRAGHRVRVLAEAPRPGQTLPGGLPAELEEVVRYRVPPRRLRLGNRRRFGLALGQALVASPRSALELLQARDLSLHQRMQLLELMVSVVELGDADVFHCHFGVLGAELSRVLAALRFRGRLVTAFHGYDVSSYVERQGPDAFDELFARGDLFLPISEHWRRRLIEMGAPADRVVVQRMGVDVADFDHTERDAAGPVMEILSVGRMVEKKGFDVGLRAISELRDRGVAVRYTIVGDGPERGRLEASTAELGLRHQVDLVGARSRPEVRRLMERSDIFLCPSRTASDGDSEGIPIVLMEAMATGMPVVSSWHSGIPELVDHGRSGLLADEGDATALSDHLHSLATDAGLAHELGDAARRAVEDEFDIGRLVMRLEARLRDLLATDSGGGVSAR